MGWTVSPEFTDSMTLKLVYCQIINNRWNKLPNSRAFFWILEIKYIECFKANIHCLDKGCLFQCSVFYYHKCLLGFQHRPPQDEDVRLWVTLFAEIFLQIILQICTLLRNKNLWRNLPNTQLIFLGTADQRYKNN